MEPQTDDDKRWWLWKSRFWLGTGKMIGGIKAVNGTESPCISAMQI
jgi:hypothetical protein